MRYSWAFDAFPELADLPKEDQYRILHVASKKAICRWQSWSLLLTTFLGPLLLAPLALVFLLADDAPNPATGDTDFVVGFFLCGAIIAIMYAAGITHIIVNRRLVKRYVRQVRQTNYWEITGRGNAYLGFKSTSVAWRKWAFPELAALPRDQRLRAVYRGRAIANRDWRFWVFITFVVFLSLGMMLLGVFASLVFAVAIGAAGQQPQPTTDPLAVIMVLILILGGIIVGGVVTMPFVFFLAILLWRPYLREASQMAQRQGA